MKNRLHVLIGLVAMLLGVVPAQAQDPAFSQFYNTPFQTNPAMLSFRPEMMVGANFRTQWNGVGVPFTSFLVDGFYPILDKKKTTQLGAAGGFVMTDRQPAGKINTTSFGIAGSYKLPVNYSNYFHCGIQLGYMRRSLNTDNLTTGSQVVNGYYDPSQATQELTGIQSRGAPTIGLGTSWVNEDVDGDIRAQLGIAAYHLNGPNVSFYSGGIDNLKRNFTATGSVRALKTNQLAFYPSFRYIFQGSARMLNVGGLMRFPLAAGATRGPKASAVSQPGHFGFGLFYQPNDASAVIGTVEWMQNNFAVSINYDLGIGSLKDGNKQGNAAEVFIAYRKTIGKKRKVDLRYFKTDKNSEGGTGGSDGGGVSEPATPSNPPTQQTAPTPTPTPVPVVPTPAPTPVPQQQVAPTPKQEVAPPAPAQGAKTRMKNTSLRTRPAAKGKVPVKTSETTSNSKAATAKTGKKTAVKATPKKATAKPKPKAK